MAVVDVPVGRSHWPLTFRDEDLIALSHKPAGAAIDARSAVVAALERPIRFEEFRRALTPDDRIALAVDESLPHLAELVAGVLEYLARAGIPPSAVTAVSPSGSTQDWINDLPETMVDLQTEVHQPDDRKKLSYLAATKDGRRIYLNRTLVDADQSIVLSARGYDPLLGRSGAESAIYPALADTDTMRSLVPKLAPQNGPDDEWPEQKEAAEVAWLLGSPFFVQVIQGSGDDIVQVVAGMADSSPDGAKLNDQVWKSKIAELADIAVVTLTGDPSRHDFAAIARAAATGARAVKPDGSVIILTEAESELGGATDVLRRCDDPPEAVRTLFREKPADAAAAVQWSWAAGRAKLYLASEIRPTLVEEIFATPLTGPREVQRMLDAPGRCVIIPDADKAWVALS